MPDARPARTTRSLLNIPTPAFDGPAAALYGPRGPQRAHNTGRSRRALSAPPHVQDAIARVPDLSPRQRLALRNVLIGMTRDLSFERMISEQVRGLWSEAALRGDDGAWPAG
jgi:hypothetical protein